MVVVAAVEEEVEEQDQTEAKRQRARARGYTTQNLIVLVKEAEPKVMEHAVAAGSIA